MSTVVTQANEQPREAILAALGEAVAAGELPGEPIPTCTLYIGDAETGAVRPVQCPPLETPVSVPTAGMLVGRGRTGRLLAQKPRQQVCGVLPY